MPSVSQAALKKPPASAQTTLDIWTPRPGSPVSAERIGQLMESAAEIEARDPWSAKMVKYAGRCFIQANLPHSSRNIDPFSTFTRTNGKMTLQIKPDSKYGIPYGTIPRLLLMWIANEVRTKKNPAIALGDTLSPFMRQLDIVPTGGQWGTVTRLKDQMLRLFNADIRFRYEDSAEKDAENAKGKLYSIEDYDLWWGRKTDVTQSAFWQSTIVLTGPLFRELLMHSVPIDMRVIKALRREPDGVGCILLADLPDALAGLLPIPLLQRAGPAIRIVVQQREAFPSQYKQGTVGCDEAVHPSPGRDRRHSPGRERLAAPTLPDACPTQAPTQTQKPKVMKIHGLVTHKN